MKKAVHQLIEWIGWFGVLCILLAYTLVSFEVMLVENPIYPILNIFGALAIILDAWVDRNYQPVVLNIVWLLIAVIALIRLFL